MQRRLLLLITVSITCAQVILAEDIPTIPMHIVVISDRAEVAESITPESAQWLADSLNREFHMADGRALARFTVAQVTPASKVAEIAPPYMNVTSTSEFSAMRKQVLQSPFFRRDTLNIFIYYNPKKSSRSQGGLRFYRKKVAGRLQTDYWTWILFEWKAFRRQDGKLLLHEAGHAFGLPHVKPVPGDENSPDRNIMTGSDEAPKALPPGESGYYFTPSQSETVSKCAAGMVETFGRAAKGDPLVSLD